MIKSKKFLISLFALFFVISIIAFCLLGYNSDIVNAAFKQSSDTGSIVFPYTSFDTNLISSNFFGMYYNGGNTASLSFPTSQSTLPNGNTFAQQNNSVSSTYSLKNYTYKGFNYSGLYTTQMFNNNNNSSSYLNFTNLSLQGGTTYTFSILLHDIVNGISNTNYHYFRVAYAGPSVSYTTLENVTIKNVYDNKQNDGYLLYYITFTPTNTINRINVNMCVGGTYNFYLVEGSNPVYYDNTSNYQIGNISMSSSSSTTSTTFTIMFKNSSSLSPETTGGSVSGLTFNGGDLLGYSYIYNQLMVYSKSIFPVVMLNVNNLNIPVFLIFQEFNSTDSQFYGTWIKFTGVGALSSSANVTVTLYLYSSGYYELDLVTTNTGIRYNTINIGFYQNVGLSLSSSISWQRGYEKGLEDLNTKVNNAYNSGYGDGLDVAENGTFLVLLSSIVEAPFRAFLDMFDFVILGYNMKSFLGALITLSVALFVIRMILNGSTKNG